MLRDENKRVERFFKWLDSDVSIVSAFNMWHSTALIAFGIFTCLYTLPLNFHSNPTFASFNFIFSAASLILILMTDIIFVKSTPASESLLLRLMPLYAFFYRAAYPFVLLGNFVLKPFFRSKKQPASMTEDDLLMIVEEASEQGVLEKEEKEMINNVFQLSDTMASEIMIPRLDVVAVEKDTPLKEVLNVAMKHGHSRLPVYDESVDRVVGIIHTKDLIAPLFSQNMKQPLSMLMRPPMVIPRNKKIDEMLRDMQSQKTAMAIVIDEYGGTDGIVTMEDIVEEIVGDITDEYDKITQIITKIDDKTFMAAGRASIEEINDALGISIENRDFETISGYVYELAGHIPAEGEIFEDNGIKIFVEKVLRHRITLLKIEIVQENG